MSIDFYLSKLSNLLKQFKLNLNDYKILRLSIFPLILAQVLQRMYFVVDNHFIAKLGSEALLINNIQFSFLYIGQYIGTATATSCLIFWNRQEYKEKQGSVFLTHMLLCVVASFICVAIGYTFSHRILNHFSVPPEYQVLAENYFKCGLLNLILQSIFVGLLGVMVSIGKERLTFLVSGLMLLFATAINYFTINTFFNGLISPEAISKPLYIIIISNSILLFLSSFCMMFFVDLRKNFQKLLNIKEIFRVWGNELSGGFLTSIDPIIYVFQLGLVITSSSLLVTYQLLMQLAAIFCILLIGTMQVCIRDASKSFCPSEKNSLPNWLKTLVVFGIIPTEILLFIFMIFPQYLFKFFYGYNIPKDQLSYVILFIFASMIGQIGNALTVPIRAKKNNHFVTLVYFISDYFILLLGMQILIYYKMATPFNSGIVMLTFTIGYTVLHGYFAYKSVKK